MKNINFKTLIGSAVIFSFLGWIILLTIKGVPLQINSVSLSYLPNIVTFDVLLWLAFVKWGWRWRIFQGWLVPFPVLRGTWYGSIQTTWVDDSIGRPPDPIPIILVIRQSFLMINCTVHSHTADSSSQSYAAEFLLDFESGVKSLIYSYTNKPRVSARAHSEIHDGTAKLNIITHPKRRLEGEYWTTRRTVGEMILAFHSSSLEETFPESLKKKAL
jgi:SMODS-associating 2TM, beta-strand rich effector domain